MSVNVRIRNGLCPDPTTGDGGATEGDIRGSFSDIIDVVGVKDLAGGHALVTQNSPAAMSVLVAPGVVYIPNADYDELDSDQVRFWEAIVTVSTAVTITANTSGSARVDLICAKMDTTITPDEHASNIATLVAIAGTPGAGAPATPDNHYVLAQVAVANGASTIITGNITDKRVQAKIDFDYLPKATGAEINTGTEDAKIVTPKAIEDSNLARTTDKLSSFAATTSAELAGVVSDETGSGSLVFGTAPTLNSPVLQGNVDGWIADTDTWVYVSASTFKIEGKNVTTKFPKGTRLKFTQTTAKYAVVTASSFSTDTTVTIAVNTNYTIDNADITSPNYSYQENPQGYPDWFSFTPSIAGSNFGNTATITGKYRLDGRTCYFRIGVVLGGTGISIGSTILTLPITIDSTAYGTYSIIGHGSAFNGSNTFPVHIAGNGQMFFYNNIGATDIVKGNNFSSSTPFTWAAPHTLYQQGFYEIA